MNSIMIPWVPTNEYIKSLRDDPKFSEVNAENIKSFVGEPSYTTDFLQNLKWHQEEKGIPYSEKVHCFQLKYELGREKYFKHLFRSEKNVYLLFEEVSRYTFSNSPELFVEEKLRQGISKKDVEEKGIVYEDYLSYLNEPVPFNTDD